jgi:SAM-dependent methyltransferase
MTRRSQQPDYGLDSPGIVAGETVCGVAGLAAAWLLHLLRAPAVLWIASLALGGYFLLNAAGMVNYSRWGKLRLRARAVALVRWRGDERVLDVGCGRGLLLVATARHLTTGRAVGVDRWVRGAVSGNSPEAALHNAAIEGVAERVEVTDGDARELPFADGSFDVVVFDVQLGNAGTTGRLRLDYQLTNPQRHTLCWRCAMPIPLTGRAWPAHLHHGAQVHE